MANENENTEEHFEEPIGIKEKSKKSLNPKIFIVGLPLFVLQLVIVYFVTANILLTKFESAPVTKKGENVDAVEGEANDSSEEGSHPEIGVNIFPIEDIIVNPTGTNGQRLLLVSLAFDLATKEQLEALQQKEVIVKDMVISTLSSKSMGELSAVGQKDVLKTEISKSLAELLPSIKVNSVYFSKYVIN